MAVDRVQQATKLAAESPRAHAAPSAEPHRKHRDMPRTRLPVDVPPTERGQTIAIEFEAIEMPEPTLGPESMSEPEPVSGCLAAINASRRFGSRRVLCLHCARVYCRGVSVGSVPRLQRRLPLAATNARRRED
jgi:hypothetical protein